MRVYLKTNVYEEALKRIRFVFDEFEEVIVWVSGGKDSTIIVELALKVAKEMGRLPLKVGFLDQESEWQGTIDYMRELMNRPEVYPLWYQVPFKLNNSLSPNHEWLYCWKEGEEWERPKEDISIKENRYGVDLFLKLFEAIMETDFKNVRVGCISGVRTEESPSRFAGLTSRPCYKDVTWGRKYKNPNHRAFYPLYDWSYTDVWKCIHDNKFKYNKIYDYQYMYGLKITEMRVSSLHHETALKSLFYAQDVEPDTYAKLVKRMSGISSATKFGFDDFYFKELPFMFKDRKEYRDYLLDKLINPKFHQSFKDQFMSHDEEFAHLPQYDTILVGHINSILCNDFEFTKLKNIKRRESNKETRARLKVGRGLNGVRASN